MNGMKLPHVAMAKINTRADRGIVPSIAKGRDTTNSCINDGGGQRRDVMRTCARVLPRQ
jgi:hypothetical protein